MKRARRKTPISIEGLSLERAWASKICPVYTCAQERGVAHCGLCPEFPCDLLVNLAAEGGPDDIRIESAAKRAEMGDERWAEWARPRKIWAKALCPLRNIQPSARTRAGG